MTFKTVLFCVSAFLVQSISGQCAVPISSSCGCNSIAVPNNGGSFTVTSVGPIRPSGITVAADLNLDGKLDVSGAVPFLSAVAFDGQFPNSGSASVSYSCGDGCVAITQEQRNPSENNAASSSGLNAAQLSGCGLRYK